MNKRAGSPWTGCGIVAVKEINDHLRSARMLVLELLVLLTGIAAVYSAIQGLRTTTGQDAFLFLRLFTDARNPMPSFAGILVFLIPLMAIGLGFDGVNGEFNRRTMSRILAQPIFRDALLLGKFLAGLATLSIGLLSLWLLVIGLGLLTLGIPPGGSEVARALSFLLLAVLYGGLWLAIALFMVMQNNFARHMGQYGVANRAMADRGMAAHLYPFRLSQWPAFVEHGERHLAFADVVEDTAKRNGL